MAFKLTVEVAVAAAKGLDAQTARWIVVAPATVMVVVQLIAYIIWISGAQQTFVGYSLPRHVQHT